MPPDVTGSVSVSAIENGRWVTPDTFADSDVTRGSAVVEP
jgi:hypothetical protein